jgi:hypothetical protein
VAGDAGQQVLYVVVCAAPAAADVENLVRLAQDARWRVCVITSPMGRRFVDIDRLGSMTGEPVRSEYGMPDEPNELPPADALIVAPATFNTVNKWASGITDTFAVGLLCELTGLRRADRGGATAGGRPRPSRCLRASLEALRSMGVRVLFDPSAPPHARMPSGKRSSQSCTRCWTADARAEDTGFTRAAPHMIDTAERVVKGLTSPHSCAQCY